MTKKNLLDAGLEDRIHDQPAPGMDNDGKLNIVGFDKDYLPGGPKDPNKGKEKP